jgi:L-alanine-DL-glutamate epimerase-like enolase superfamily enzyme
MPRILEIRETAISIRSEIRNAWISFAEMDASLVAVVSDVVRDGRPLVGFGFSSNGRYAAGGILRDRVIPRVLGAVPDELLDDTGDNFDPGRIWDVMMRNEKPGGHGERSVAVGVVDMAVFDLVAKIEEKPLYRLLADRYGSGPPDPTVFVYAAGGYYYPGKGLKGLQDEMRRYLELGYEVVKMKIGGASLDEDLRRIDAVVEVVGYPSRVAVDANGRFDVRTALAYAAALEPYGLFWYEEAGDPLDYALQAELCAVYPNPVATGENLFSVHDAQNLVRYGGMRSDRDFLQFDPVLSYGLVEYLRTLDMLERNRWSPRRCIPHGGHQFALHMAAGLNLAGNESYPGVFEPIGGFSDDTPVVAGRISPGDEPGIGIEQKRQLYSAFRDLLAN